MIYSTGVRKRQTKIQTKGQFKRYEMKAANNSRITKNTRTQDKTNNNQGITFKRNETKKIQSYAYRLYSLYA